VVLLGEWVIDGDLLNALFTKAEKTLHGYAQRYPLRIGMPSEELRRRLDVNIPVFDVLLHEWQRDIERVGDGLLRRVGYRVVLTNQQQRDVQTTLTQLRAAPFSPPDIAIERELLLYMVMTGQVVEVNDGVIFDAAAWHDLYQWITQTIDQSGSVSVAQLRDRFQTTRKYALAVLEYLDAKRITRRQDDVRVRYRT